ncbi:MAG: nodulation protein NodH [Rhodobacteraceae bacterium]|nr:nodulation protein NodH [Paracoccaceae bacterium]
MAGRFRFFAILAEMRTGSNFLEDNINRFDALSSHGELFNPYFIGGAGKQEYLGISLAERDADPFALLERVISHSSPAIAGFRLFHDHDPRILDHVIDNPDCAKIVLTRNPFEAYISRKVAAATGQWRLTDLKYRADARIRFEPDEFEAHVAGLQSFRIELQRRLQVTAQTAFHINYDDLGALEVINGLGTWLGAGTRLEALSKTLKKQNLEPPESKVENPEEMHAALARIDTFGLARTPDFEPRRGPVVPRYVACPDVGLLFMPMEAGPRAGPLGWMAAHQARASGRADGEEALLTGFNQKSLRQWRRRHPGHMGFTVLRHPAMRAHSAFCRHILPGGPGAFVEIREMLRKEYKLPLPTPGKGMEGYGPERHREAFMGFLRFLKANVAGQTAVRVDPAWASQSAMLQGMAGLAQPDLVAREDRLAEAAIYLEGALGLAHLPLPHDAEEEGPFRLVQIHDPDLEQAISEVYARDYLQFGFGPWRA